MGEYRPAFGGLRLISGNATEPLCASLWSSRIFSGQAMIDIG